MLVVLSSVPLEESEVEAVEGVLEGCCLFWPQLHVFVIERRRWLEQTEDEVVFEADEETSVAAKQDFA